MSKWEFDVADLNGLKKCKVVVSEKLKYKIVKSDELKNAVNLAWAIYVRNAPPFLTIPMPENSGLKEIVIHCEKDVINIS